VTRITVRSLMSRDPIVISTDAPIAEAARMLDQYGVHGLPVVDGLGGLVGVVSQTDMVRARGTEELWQRWPGLRVHHLMTAPALTIDADAGVAEAAARMERERVHRLVVVDPDGSTPIGIVSTTDLVRAMLTEEAEA
jgi:CBS domain-containing protein